MNAPRIVLHSAFLFLAVPVNICGQQAPLALGDRVRVTVPPKSLVGTLVSLEPDTCVVQMTGAAEPLFLPLDDLTKLEVYRGPKRSLRRAVVLGLISGAWGAAVGAGSCALLRAGFPGGDPYGEVAMRCAVPLGVLGLLGGFTSGALIRSDSWEEVPLDRLRVGVVPVTSEGRSGIGVGVTLRV